MKHPFVRVLILLLVLLLLIFIPPAAGYENNGPGKSLYGGSHRKINRMSGALFIQNLPKAEDADTFKKYNFQPLEEGKEIVVKALNEDVTDEMVKGVFKPIGETIDARIDWRDAAYEAARKNVPMKFSSWVIEGGFTADEPERFMSLRHFYNPLSKFGPEYLTDIPKGAGWTVMGSNPQIDAVTWATTHSDNAYNWFNGFTYLDKAFTAGTVQDAMFNYAAAWRSLGETMHLMADMTVPAHVRNDSHPGDIRGAVVFDDLRADAYETLMNWYGHTENGWSGRIMDPNLLKEIQDETDVYSLFELVSGYVNQRFFSSDTIPYVNIIGNLSANNCSSITGFVYPSPRIENMTYDEKTGYYTAPDFQGGDMIMAHKSWLDDDGWDNYPGQVNMPVADSQAKRLIPIAVNSNAQLMSLFMPLVEVEVSDVVVDEKTNDPIITGEIAVYPNDGDGGYQDKPSDTLMKNTEQSLLVFVQLKDEDGKTKELIYLAPPTKLEDGEFEISLEDCTNEDGLYDILHPKEGSTKKLPEISYAVGWDMGGILVRSDYFENGDIVGFWDLETTYTDVIIPPELLQTEGMGEEEAAAYLNMMRQAYGATLVGQTFQSRIEIAKSGNSYVLKQQYDPEVAAQMAQAGVNINYALTLKGNEIVAISKQTYEGGGVVSEMQATLSANKKEMAGDLSSIIDMSASGIGNIEYRGTWKAVKDETP